MSALCSRRHFPIRKATRACSSQNSSTRDGVRILHVEYAEEEKNTAFYGYLACFVNTFTLNIYVSMSYTRVNQAKYGIHILVVAPQEYVNTYSTRGVSITCFLLLRWR